MKAIYQGWDFHGLGNLAPYTSDSFLAKFALNGCFLVLRGIIGFGLGLVEATRELEKNKTNDCACFLRQQVSGHLET